MATPPSTVMYMVVVTDTLCNTSDSAQVLVRVVPAFAVDLGADLVLCPGESATLSTGISGAPHLWSTNENTATIEVSDPGTYWVTVDQDACTGSDTVLVQVAPDPGELLISIYTCVGRSETLTIPYEGVSYLWEGGETTRAIVVDQEGIYTFSVTDAYGCTYAGEATVGADPLGYGVTVPNVFSPNNDGSNDRFELQAGGSSDVAVTIYDRWGNSVFETPSLGKAWDGRINGTDASDGTYFYIVRYQPICDEEEKEQRGHVTLLR
ncbi:MAG: gliding motility-associated C-terminal domain-containing protein [Flavobacteriales bacterium]|nr:gliding motility-associated C-terminal domain-containing protein [Flavobacteriales bacterium]